jgi:hypothetical protein
MNRKVKQVLSGGWYQCVCVREDISESCWNSSGMVGGGIKENDGGGELNYDVVKALLEMSQWTLCTTTLY